MQLTKADFERQYAHMSEDDLSVIDRTALGDVARDCYDPERAYRGSAEYREKQLKDAAEAEAREIAETKRCFFCGSTHVVSEDAAHIEMHADYEQRRGYRGVKHQWVQRDVVIARCARCRRVHRTERSLRVLAGITSFPVLIVLLMFLAAGVRDGGALLIVAPVVWYLLLLVLASLAGWLLYLLPGFRKTKSIHYAYRSLAVDRAMREGCGKGAPLTFSWDLGRMFRKFVGLVEVPGRG